MCPIGYIKGRSKAGHGQAVGGVDRGDVVMLLRTIIQPVCLSSP